MPPKTMATRGARGRPRRSSDVAQPRGHRTRRRGRARGARAGRSSSASSARELSRLEALPLALFHHIMSFALCGLRAYAGAARSDAERQLDEIALVSQAVRVHATEMQGQLALAKLHVRIDKGTRGELLALRREATLRRAFLREIDVYAFAPEALVSVQAQEEWLAHAIGACAAIVRGAPQLEMLDLSMCSGDVVEVVRAAVQNCPNLQSLVLPPYRTHQSQHRDLVHGRDTQPLLDALFDGLQTWHRHSGGLRQLRIPTRQNTKLFASSADFLLGLYTYCPKIELLDGAMTMVYDEHGEDEWIVDRTVWDRFCETCLQLRAFNWVSVPWATDFFETFSRYKKPQLRELTLKTTMTWNWAKFFEEVGAREAAAIKTSGYGATANRVHLVLKACPALTKLTIILNSRVGDDEATLQEMDELEEYDGMDPLPPLKRENMMNQGLYSDKFCSALVRDCPLLEEFTLVEDHEQLAINLKNAHPILRFQDPALQSLAKLRHLSRLDLKAVNVTGRGIFTLVSSAVNEAPGTRCYDLSLGDEQKDHEKSFYTAMHDFMKCMLNHKGPLVIPTKKIYLCVTNGNNGAMEMRWSEGYLGRLKGMIRALRRKYPALTFRVETDGLTNKSFSTIFAFGFYTSGAVQPVDSRWVDIPEDALVEDVFVMEEVLDEYDDNDFEDEDDDFFDDEHDFGDDDEDEGEFSDEDDDDDAGEGRRAGYYGDYQNERGHYGMGGFHFFNGLQLPDIGPLRIRDQGDEEHEDFFDGAGYDHGGYDY